MDRHSPLALSIALHLHYNVVKHKGYETVHRISLQFAKILQGRVLMKDVSEDCIFCKKLRLDYQKQVMGPLSDLQLSISPVFYYTYIDAWGPVKSYVPGFERETRSGTKTHQLLMVVFACAATGMINCQMMEGGEEDWTLSRCLQQVHPRMLCSQDLLTRSGWGCDKSFIGQ